MGMHETFLIRYFEDTLAVIVTGGRQALVRQLETRHPEPCRHDCNKSRIAAFLDQRCDYISLLSPPGVPYPCAICYVTPAVFA